MDTRASARLSFVNLFRTLTRDARAFVRQEIQLTKTEMTENLARFGRNATGVAIGGLVAHAGLIVFMIGLGYSLAWAFESAGVQPVLAGFLGLVGVGLLVIAVGCVLLLNGMKHLSHESVAPQRTIQTIQELKGSAPIPTESSTAEPKVSSAELQARVEVIENRIGETLNELGRRMRPAHLKAEVRQHIAANPYRLGLIAMAAGLIGGLLLRRKFSPTS